MAIRKRGKNGIYSCYYRGVMTDANGKYYNYRSEVSLGTSDYKTARAIEADIMGRVRAARARQRLIAHLASLDEASTTTNPGAIAVSRPMAAAPRRVKLADALKVAGQYRPVSPTAAKLWRRFAESIKVTYVDEVTPSMAFNYLDQIDNGKTYNNTKSALNAIFAAIKIPAGIEDSPFSKIPSRRVQSRHQRPITAEELRRLYNSAPAPWRHAILIAWHTGLREQDVFRLSWENIHDGIIDTLPGKTSRFGRRVHIPIHPQLQQLLDRLPRKGSRVLGAWTYNPRSGAQNRQFRAILDAAGIHDNADGIVNFNSLRNSFISRLDAAGLPRHAIRGMVGHVSDSQTDLYSHDETTPRAILALPPVDLDLPPK